MVTNRPRGDADALTHTPTHPQIVLKDYFIKLCTPGIVKAQLPNIELSSPFRLFAHKFTLAMSSELILVRDSSSENLRRTWLRYPKVTGVNGFLGAHVVDQLVQKGYRVRGYATARIFICSG